ncbi:MAG TPA: glycosyl hydrolase 53 family protein, partial [Capsulimonadaceae bacterium]|nr:glycosyl hydrolase 53 family protein [Capsulimonadaceae bacterium]
MKHPVSRPGRLTGWRWRATLILFAAIMAIPQAASAKTKPLDPANLPFLAGGDISLLTWEEQHGTVYKDHGKPEDMLKIFKDHGCNFMRLRIWVNPSEKGIFVNDLAYTVALGKRIKKAGFYLDIDFHYSDSWADPGKQIKPAAWRDLPFDQLVTTMQNYTRDAIAAMRKGGAMPDIVQIGNEITPGMLWPDGRDSQGGRDDFANLATLL